ncbi:helix-turn-helix transcriptional regulator [Streptomyces sp. Amel2xC10]|uniref:helix-turn-helix domain-containing protein n=1 Tax=Streptomyces sp. Amel2xC10 TaxID=1305826 RepID=UPI000A087CE8|nr:helix-turn-helix transcriptional regulator [Streptomyces sp. Amel2xC10]SMF18837.1 Predicted transcriptional regulators [Streptomyces sp. Amel2xC10]
MAAADFAELLRELKDRSGLSYGTLAKRLHMSTSTLHRYCNGDAVPTDYAPVERMARLCKASPDELVALHRSWVLADAGRGKKGAEPVSEPEPEPVGVTEPEPEPVAVPVRVRRPLVLAGVGALAALGSVALTLALVLPGGGSDGDGDAGGPVGAAESVPGRGTPSVSASSSVSPSPSPSSSSPSESVSASPSSSASPSAGSPSAGKGAGAAVPLTVTARPFAWESPCEQHYLIRQGPQEVSPPPVEQDAPAWVSRHGAVSAGQQYLELTVQGTGAETVVVDRLTVRTVARRSPLAWNDYAMGYPGVGCGGGVPTRSFSIALDAARPAPVPEAGHPDFPFKVSESDPEVYYVTADASAYDVRWYLELSWSSGSRHGTLRIDDEGKPFRTSGDHGRPAYEFPLGGSAWRPAGVEG